MSIIVKIDESRFPNLSKGSFEDREYHFKGGIVGQRVEIKARGKKSKKAKLLSIIERSDIEIESQCPHFEKCGGCTYQTLTYEEELKYKKELIKNLFKENGIEREMEIIPSPVHKDYRNKMEYTFGDEYKGGPLSLGLHVKNRFHEIINTTDCNIVDEDFNTIRAEVRNYFEDLGEVQYNRKRHEGFLRHLLIRKATKTGEIMVLLSTSSQSKLDEEAFIKFLLDLDLEGQIVSIYHVINDALSDAIVPEEMKLIYGKDHIEEEVLGLRFKISPFSFFQTNTKSAEVLYKMAREKIDAKDKLVFDLYSGTGTITQVLAESAKKVIGVEIVEEAVEAARENAKLNGIDNVEFIASDVLKVLDDLDKNPDLIVLDPPREGINPRAIEKIIDFDPEKFLYISCNPVTLVRDIGVFKERGYKIEELEIVDQFPKTSHVEAAILMTYCGLDKE
ncbi:23S rRNA (uracil(1939)-C(5))-methyltransferase RlmD [Peptoniphilus harei]|uniref:23S rRNA (uracil(1939)-C(5))-methyltransferase RlmD n=1 Tax=Peptoniphilus harei TaxID=54005 RepID=UPI0029104C41|nr:23S rRNA (uracil(1939)-C(5))-methyltransferase RlmD [Peptoniphilus harei]MDU6099089.1 23S rRNA (uracil(1939)-C(5))-methyltransferase RlmD [Peptoniphilus harei]